MRLLLRLDPTRSRPRPVSRQHLLVVLIVALFAAVASVAPATATATATSTSPAKTRIAANGLAELDYLKPVVTCADVLGMHVTDDNGDAVKFSASTAVTTGTTQPYCKVTGTIAPANQFEIHLPLNGWSQRYVQTGCGGLCGSVNVNVTQGATCPLVVDGSLVTAATDMGHEGGNDGSWALNNPQAVIDFAYRSQHVLSIVTKKVIKKFYGKAPAYSYFDGCSDGGREALMEAQRYPDDFDGIAAGAPANNMAVQNTIHHAWNVLTNLDSSGKFILLADKLPIIHAAVLAKCDGIDGVKDGLLQNPTQCNFDPYSLVCAKGQTANCLTKAEAGVVWRLHNGATDKKGTRLEPAIAHEWGSELDWTLFVPSAQGQTPMSANFALSYLRYLVDPNNQNPNLQLTDFKFTTQEFWKAVQSSSYEASLDPNLTGFQASGGKLLLWHGWEDQHISPQNTLAYYDAVKKTMGTVRANSFVKLYLFPGVAHCGGGEGPNQFDVLTPVMAWTESGRTPTKIIASRIDQTSGAVTMTRPVYPYPQQVRWTGKGSTNDAKNFVAYTPRVLTGTDYRWVGQRLFSEGYQTTCTVDGVSLVCRPKSTWLTRQV
ncbi:feruloyl esterase [Branchiibius hedensis]|uniref:Feruloyl esterase n=1 Tax=Branchiibius hedensis TaxID=672460 RepID=A0A2Y9BUF9_9MICO|nr:tannase/feruloyl esterase family alpha/beta hydrolase [Branchiibius hedensis]PWJ26831.1 feruloyl esterase [Branchiibius hedensis]SSA35642.1 feruloyl esterase [Branchiibius hedensis]